MVVLDRDVDALRRVQDRVGFDVPTMIATRRNLEKALGFADLFLCAVAVHGERTPVLVTRDMLKLMKPRSVIMDLSIDQGGCCETSRPTDFSNPTYEVDGIIHFCVPNLPSTASRASTRALTNAILPYVEEIADKGFDRAVADNRALRRGTYTYDGACVRKWLAERLGVALPRPGGECAVNWVDIYRRRVTTADRAVADIRSGDRVWVHPGCNTPTRLIEAMVARAPGARERRGGPHPDPGRRRRTRRPAWRATSATAPCSWAPTSARRSTPVAPTSSRSTSTRSRP